MAKLLQLRRGTTSQHSSFTGAEGEVTVDTDKDTLVVHDNATAGGKPLAIEANTLGISSTGATASDSITIAGNLKVKGSFMQLSTNQSLTLGY